MSHILLFVETQGDSLKTSSLPAFTFGQELAAKTGGKLFVALIGKTVAGAAAEAAKFGAAEVITVSGDSYEHYLAETYAAAITKIAQGKDISIVAGTATSVGKDVLPRVAALIQGGLVSDVVGITDKNRFLRPIMAGNIVAEAEALSPKFVVTVRQTAFAPAAPGAAASPINAFDAGAVDALGASFISVASAKSDRPDLTEAKVVVSGGRGMKEAKNFEALAEIADLLGGALGASRAAADAGMVPNDLQVGQTGKVVAPQLYIAVAISGAIQHLAGMKSSKVIVAINKDPEAPIFQVADYGLVTTWEQALPELKAAITQLKAAR